MISVVTMFWLRRYAQDGYSEKVRESLKQVHTTNILRLKNHTIISPTTDQPTDPSPQSEPSVYPRICQSTRLARHLIDPSISFSDSSAITITITVPLIVKCHRCRSRIPSRTSSNLSKNASSFSIPIVPLDDHQETMLMATDGGEGRTGAKQCRRHKVTWFWENKFLYNWVV